MNLRGEIVWQYLSPIYTDSASRFGVTNAINRAIRYEWDYAGLENMPFDDQDCAALNAMYGPFAAFKQK